MLTPCDSACETPVASPPDWAATSRQVQRDCCHPLPSILHHRLKPQLVPDSSHFAGDVQIAVSPTQQQPWNAWRAKTACFYTHGLLTPLILCTPHESSLLHSCMGFRGAHGGDHMLRCIQGYCSRSVLHWEHGRQKGPYAQQRSSWRTSDAVNFDPYNNLRLTHPRTHMICYRSTFTSAEKSLDRRSAFLDLEQCTILTARHHSSRIDDSSPCSLPARQTDLARRAVVSIHVQCGVAFRHSRCRSDIRDQHCTLIHMDIGLIPYDYLLTVRPPPPSSCMPFNCHDEAYSSHNICDCGLGRTKHSNTQASSIGGDCGSYKDIPNGRRFRYERNLSAC